MASDETKTGDWISPVPRGTESTDDVLADKAERSVFDSDRELEALRAEVERLRGSVQEIASRSRRLANAELGELKNSAEETLKQNVFLSVGIAALIGYLWGRTRR